MEQIHDRVAGLDVHRDQVTVSVRTPGPRGGVRGWSKPGSDTTTRGLAALAGWLAGREVTLARTWRLTRLSSTAAAPAIIKS